MSISSDFPFTPETNPSRPRTYTRTYTPIAIAPGVATSQQTRLSPSTSGLLTGIPESAHRSVGRLPSGYTLIPGGPDVETIPSKRKGWTQLGKGGQATVYKTPQDQAARVFALRDPADWESLISDISIPVHPYLQPVEGVEFFPRNPYATTRDRMDQKMSTEPPLAIEFQPLAQGDIFDQISKPGQNKFDELTALKWFYEIMCGLAALHAGGILHNDLKPENILLVKNPDEKQPHAVVADFGLITRNPETACVMGTQMYKSPETAGLWNYCTDKADVWAAGMIGMYLFFPDTRNFTASVYSNQFIDDKLATKGPFNSFLIGEIFDPTPSATWRLTHLNQPYIIQNVRDTYQRGVLDHYENYNQPGFSSSNRTALHDLVAQAKRSVQQFYNAKTPLRILLQAMLRWDPRDRPSAAQVVRALDEMPSVIAMKLTCQPAIYPPFPPLNLLSEANVARLPGLLEKYVDEEDTFDSDDENASILRLWAATGDPKTPKNSYHTARSVVKSAYGNRSYLKPEDYAKYYNALRQLNWQLSTILSKGDIV